MPRDRATPAEPRPARVLFAPQEPRPLRPDAAGDVPRYRRWAAAQDAWRLAVERPPPPGPELTLLMVVGCGDGPPAAGPAVSGPDSAAAVRRTLASVTAQTVTRWSLVVTIVGTPDMATEAAVTDVLGTTGPHGAKAKLHTLPSGTAVADAYAAALELTSSPAFAFLEPGDALAPDAVARLGAALLDADVAYADEDRIDDLGLIFSPVLKPDWSPELFCSWRYTGRPVALRVAPVTAAGGIRVLPGGDWEHDLLLRVVDGTSRVAHVAAVLCHRGAGDAPSDGPAAVVGALERRHEPAEVGPGPVPGTWTVQRRPRRDTTTVSAIVPFRDSTTLLRACAESLRTGAGCSRGGNSTVRLELVLVDNGSTEPETATLVERLVGELSQDVRVDVRRDDRPFNWAALNNAAAAGAHGDVLLFLNDDVQGGATGWIEALATQALRPPVAAVGARLVYPDGRLQHAGIVLGMAGATGHVLSGLRSGLPGYLGMAVLTRDVSAVTGACMATRRDVFDELGGFDESLGLDFNDVDYCLRARRRGLRVVYDAGVELVHHESPSRGTSGSEETAAAFLARWGAAVQDGDPFFNRNLSHLDFSAALDEPGAVVAGATSMRSVG